MLNFLEKIRMQQRHSSRLDCLQRRPGATFFHGNTGPCRGSIVRFGAREHLNAIAVIGINRTSSPDFSWSGQVLRTLQHHRVQPVLRAHAQSVFAHDLGDFCYRAAVSNPKSPTMTNASLTKTRVPFFQLRGYTRSTFNNNLRRNHDMRGLLRIGAEKGADPVRGEVTFLRFPASQSSGAPPPSFSW